MRRGDADGPMREPRLTRERRAAKAILHLSIRNVHSSKLRVLGCTSLHSHEGLLFKSMRSNSLKRLLAHGMMIMWGHVIFAYYMTCTIAKAAAHAAPPPAAGQHPLFAVAWCSCLVYLSVSLKKDEMEERSFQRFSSPAACGPATSVSTCPLSGYNSRGNP